MGNLDDTISNLIEIEFEKEFKDLEKDNNKILDKDKLIKKVVSIFNSNKIIFILYLIALNFKMRSDKSIAYF
jgi:hypothetical protein